ncbi:nucleoside triphosphate pyrophosphohydrolase [Parvularcula marina]|uniref:Nucleoside triphosphate pyrophosphohydrolase n=1 Tax=Parvularcula marina TaxID=2292771 RepID=A0A371RG12_9PROT|nr:nucleoside triphosphate pyrophosphohydrolase [Parvularcula marina]RFB04365.1 nucleoside triphosphate pyrophosphohydrolase [Parvularcula marina]
MAFDPPSDRRSIEGLRAIMANLRAPEGGCPWDLEQDHRSIASYCLEEAYEVVDAIENGTDRDLCEELGDLLLQVVFHAQMAAERGAFDFDDVVEAISDKMVRRHPHVFDSDDGRDADGQTAAWEEIKAQEKAERGKTEDGVLDGIPVGLPALTRAEKIAKRAMKVGFDWPDWRGVTAKLREELAEVEEAILEEDEAHIREEVGDFLFTAACLTRATRLDGETVLREANEKFRRRFASVEAGVRDSGRSWEEHTLDQLEAYWAAGKAKE